MSPRSSRLWQLGLLIFVLALRVGEPSEALQQDVPLPPGTEPTAGEPGKGESGKKVKPRIDGLTVELGAGDHLLVSFTLTHAIDENMEQRIESGLATDLDYRFELVRPRWYWFNRTVERSRLQVITMYNATRREYLVNIKHDGQLIASQVVRDRNALHRAMTELSGIDVFTLTRLRGDLRLRVRAELGTGSFLFFFPTVRATDWAEARLEIDSDGEVRIRRTD